MASNGDGPALIVPPEVWPADDKALADPAVIAAIRTSIRRSVVAPETSINVPGSVGGDLGSVFWIATTADGIAKWGVAPSIRDRQLRLFYPTESVLQSAVSSVIARNMGFDWALTGPDAQVNATYDLLHSANRGAGWTDWIGTISADLYTQDKGAFSEIIRTANDPAAPTIGIQHLDAARCFHTGDPEIPVVYVDRKGKWHELKWFQVITFAEMPAPHELLWGLQYSALTRVLKAAQIFRNIQIYRDEKTGGRHTRAIHLVGGIESDVLEDALRSRTAFDDAAGRERFATTPVVTALNPTIPPSVATIELAGLPDAFDAEQAFKEYLTIMALGLLVDFQELAPLPGGSLGSSAQSEILHLKSRGKGPALFMKLIEQKLNFHGVIPRAVTFEFDEMDVDADEAVAKVGKVRAETRKLMVEVGTIDEQGSRQLALDAGDIPQEVFDELDGGDLTGAPRRSTDKRRQENEGRDAPKTGDETLDENDETKERDPDRAGPEGERLDLEVDVATTVKREGLDTMRRRIRKRLDEMDLPDGE